MALIVFGQPQLVTKYMGLKDGRTMGTVIITGVIYMSITTLSLLIIGTGGRHLFGDQFFSNPDIVAPSLASVYGNVFVSALFLIGCMAAGLSTIAALFLTSSAAISRDIYEDGILGVSGRVIEPKNIIKLSRIVTGIVILATLLLSLRPWSIVFHLSTAAAGTLGAAFTAPTLMGLYWRRATKEGCLASMISGALTCTVWYIFDLGLTHPFVPGTIVSFALFIIVSMITQVPSDSTIDLFFKKGLKVKQE